MTLKDTILQIIDERGLKHWTFFLKKDVALLDQIMQETANLPDDTLLTERCAVILGHEMFCPNGNKKTYNSIKEGFRYCGRAAKCQCAQEAVSEKCSIPRDRTGQVEKTKVTLLEKYGVDNAGKLQSAIEGRAEYYKNLVPVPKKKGKYYPKKIIHPEWHDEEIPAGKFACKICNKALRDVTKHLKIHNITREEYIKKYPDAQLVSEDIMAIRVKALKEHIITDEQKKTLSLSKLGKKKSGEFVLHPEALDILNDKSRIEELYKEYSKRSIAKILGVTKSTVDNHFTKHGIDSFLSSGEEEIGTILNKLNIEYQHNTRSIIGPQELDFYIPDLNLAIEINGLYYHCEKFKTPSYHQDKLNICSSKNIRLISIFEDEIHNKLNIVENRLKNLCKKSEKGPGARKLTICKISREIANIFYEKTHIQGGSKNNAISYGAYDGDRLVGAMSFKKSWRLGSDWYELARFSTDGRTYAGLASRLFNAFVKEHDPYKVVTYADRRWSEGKVYEQMGFTMDKRVPYSYTYWTQGGVVREDKSKYRLKVISPWVEDGHLKTEHEIMLELGYYRIYDCGYYRFVWKKSDG